MKLTSKKTPEKKSLGSGNRGAQLLDTRELAEALGESPRSVRTWVSRGILPVVVLGYRTRRFRLADCLDALDRRTVKPRT